MGLRKISAKELLEDINLGLGYYALMDKYGLPEAALGGMLSRMTSAGMLTDEEVDELRSGYDITLTYLNRQASDAAGPSDSHDRADA
ncbi:MAG: hypothetical protein V2B18_19500 [Pseudomonadota bacterium]